MITFNNIVERFKIFADAHFFVKSFSFGSPDDVDLSKFTNFPLMHLVYTGATYDAGTKTYNLEVYILDVPADKTKKTDRQKEVVSDAEQCAEDIIADIKNGGNIFLFAQDYEVVNATTTPLEEETKNVLSGVLLDLSVAIPYEWDACNAPIDGVSPEGGDEVAYARRGILRMLTVDGSTDVLSVRTIKVTNGTLTDDGDGVVTLDTGGAESLDDLDDVTITAPLATGQVIVYDRDASPRGFHNQENSLANLTDTNITSTPANAFLRYVDGAWEAVPVTIPSPPPSTTDGLPEGETNLYYTEARVSANTDVAANTAKVGITAQQAADITANNAKVGITPTQASEITANTAKVGITTQQADDITANNAKVSLIAGGTTGQALVKSTGTDYDVEWADIAVDVQYHDRFQTDAETFRSGATDTVELYYTAKADGDGLAESASSDTPSAGKIIRRKIYYSEAAFADPDTGTWVQFADIADDTTFASAKATLLAYLKERTGGTVPISLKMTWEDVAAATLLLDTYTDAAAAYSLRKLRTAYTGDAVEVYNGSSYADIGFDGSGELDLTALATHCGSNDGFVSKWYDQSGNTNTAAQTTTSEMPKIYDGTTGVVLNSNSNPAVFFQDGISNSLPSTVTHSSDPIFITAVSEVPSGATNERSNIYTGGGSTDFEFRNWAGSQVTIRIGDGSTVATNAISGTTVDEVILLTGYNVSSSLNLFLNGTASASNPVTANYSVTFPAGGIHASRTTIPNYISEIVVYESDQSSNRTDIEDNINTFYNIY